MTYNNDNLTTLNYKVLLFQIIIIHISLIYFLDTSVSQGKDCQYSVKNRN